MAKAIAAVAVATGTLLAAGAVLPRRFSAAGVDCAIENGCGGDMVHAGVVEPVEPRTVPADEWLRLTTGGLAAVVQLIGSDRLVDLGILEP